MKKQITALALFAICGLSLSAYADGAPIGNPIRAITITSDAYSGSFAIDVLRDSTGAVSEMTYQTPSDPNGTLTLQQLESGPQVIFNTEGHDVIYLSLESDFNPATGGHLVVRYLENGADGSYKDFRVLATIGANITLTSDPDPTDADSDGNSYQGVFNQLYMEKNTFLGMTIGIKDVVPSYAAPQFYFY